MTARKPKPCTYPGCTTIAPSGWRRCVDHPAGQFRISDARPKPTVVPRPAPPMRPPLAEVKPARGATYCLPCRRWVDSLIHTPVRTAAS